jgi:hypothetical protein
MNRKVLSTAVRELNKAKAPAKPRDIFFDPSGMGMLNPNYAGKPVRLATDTLYNPTKYKIRAYADNGVSAKLNPYDTTDVTLEGAKYIDEYPELQEEGIYMDGDLSQEEIDYYAKGGFIVEDVSVPELTKAQKGKAVKPLASRTNLRKLKDEIYNENPVLAQLGDRNDFKILTARGKNKKYLENNNYGLEYFDKGWKKNEKAKAEGWDVDQLGYIPYPNKYRTMLDPKGKTTEKLKDAVRLDFLSHSLHNIPEYNAFAQDLNQKLIAEYGEQTVKGNDGVDGYIRGYLSNAPEYQPYKEELKFLPKDYFQTLDNIITPAKTPAKLFLKGGALLTKKVTCKKCGWKWDAADGGDDITTCHKCGGQGLIHAQTGVTVNSEEPKRTKFVPGTYDPETTVGYVEELPEVQAEAKAPEWVTYAREYEKKNSKQDFINDKKREYLKRNTGLNKAAGVTMDNFPETVEENFAGEYEYKRNSYIAKRYGKKHGFNPKRRGEWVEQLSPGTEAVIANSKYGSKLQPSYWSRAAAGLMNYGQLLPGEQPYVQIPGLTKKEQKEILNSKLGALEMLAPLDIPGAALANYLKNRGISTGFDYRELPGIGSGQKMSNVSDLDAIGLNPMNLIGLEGIGEMGINLVKGAKALPGAVKASKESGLLSNAYKINPWAVKENPEMYAYRARPVGQNVDMNMAAQLRAKEAAGEPLTWVQKNIIKMEEGTIPDQGGVATREKYFGRWFDDNPQNLDFYINPDTRNFADDDVIEILRSKLPRAEADKLKVSQFEDAKSLSGFPERELILPKDLVNSAERFPESSWQQLIQEDKAFNTPHWSKGYKKIKNKDEVITKANTSNVDNVLPSPPNQIFIDNNVGFDLQRSSRKPKNKMYKKTETANENGLDIKTTYRGNKNIPADITIEGKSGYWQLRPNKTAGDNTWFFSANMDNQLESGKAMLKMNEKFPFPKPSILEPNSYSLDSYTNLLNMGKRKDWSMQFENYIPLNHSAKHSTVLKDLHLPNTPNKTIFKSEVEAQKALEKINEFLIKKGINEKAKIYSGGDSFGIEIPNFKLTRNHAKGGIISKLNKKEIQDLIEQGYVIEEQ